MKNIFLVLRAKFLALSVCFAALGTVSANADSSGVIKIPTHNWSSQLVGAEVVGELFKWLVRKLNMFQWIVKLYIRPWLMEI